MNKHVLPTTVAIEEAIGVSTSARRKKRRRNAWWLLVLLAVAAGGYLWWNSRQQQSITAYDTVPAAKSDLVITASATGTIQPITKVDVGSELSGVARDVLVAENDVVKAGAVLARLDTTRLLAQQEKAKAQLAAAQSRVLTAQASLDQSALALTRQLKLRARTLSTDQEAEQAQGEQSRAEANLSAAKAEVLAAQADLALVSADLGKSTIASPIDGIVLKRSVEPGQTVAASLQAPVLFTIAQDIARMQLEANVDEADIGIVKVGQSASFTVDAYRTRTFDAKVERISYAPETVDGVVTYKTYLSADNSDLALRPGMTATAKIVVESHAGVLAVPNEVLRYSPPKIQQSQGFSITQMFMPRFPRTERSKNPVEPDGKRNIYVLENGKPVAHRVKTGGTDGKNTIVTVGDIKAGDPLVTGTQAPQSP